MKPLILTCITLAVLIFAGAFNLALSLNLAKTLESNGALDKVLTEEILRACR